MTKTTIHPIRRAFLFADEPTATGRIYPEAVLRKAVADAQTRVTEGRMFGTVSGCDPSSLTEISHKVTELRVEGGSPGVRARVIATVELLDTPKGKALADVLAAVADDFRVTLIPEGVGVTTKPYRCRYCRGEGQSPCACDDTVTVETYELTSISIGTDRRSMRPKDVMPGMLFSATNITTYNFMVEEVTGRVAKGRSWGCFGGTNADEQPLSQLVDETKWRFCQQETFGSMGVLIDALRSALNDVKAGFELELPGQWPEKFNNLLKPIRTEAPKEWVPPAVVTFPTIKGYKPDHAAVVAAILSCNNCGKPLEGELMMCKACRADPRFAAVFEAAEKVVTQFNKHTSTTTNGPTSPPPPEPHHYVETTPLDVVYKGCGKCGYGPGAYQHNSANVTEYEAQRRAGGLSVPAVRPTPSEQEHARGAELLAAANTEVARLTKCLKQANSNMETVERELYLKLNDAEAAIEKLRAGGRVVHVQPMIGRTLDFPELKVTGVDYALEGSERSLIVVRLALAETPEVMQKIAKQMREKFGDKVVVFFSRDGIELTVLDLPV